MSSTSSKLPPPLPPVTPPRRSNSTRSQANSNVGTPREASFSNHISPSPRPPFKPSMPKSPPPPLAVKRSSSGQLGKRTGSGRSSNTPPPLAQRAKSSWLPKLKSYMPRIQHTSDIIPSGPYHPNDIVLFELLDENEVWQWALGKLLCVEPTNERVAQVIPLSPSSNASQFVSDHPDQLPALTSDALMDARDAVRQLAKAKKQHEERGDDLKALLLELHNEQASTADDQRKVQLTLEEVLPALERARDAVNRISWQDLSEMRSYPTPPPIVKRVLEGVSCLLEDKVPLEAVKWKEVKQRCRGNDFVPRVRDFEGSISAETSQYVKEQFIKDPTFTLANANKASVAAGPLFEWIEAQVRCCDVIRDLAPTLAKLEAMDQKIRDNETKTAALREEQQGLFGSLQAETRKYQEAAFGIDFTLPPSNLSPGVEPGKSGPFVLDRVRRTLQRHPVDAWQPAPNTAVKRILYCTIMGKSTVMKPPTPPPPTEAATPQPPPASPPRTPREEGAKKPSGPPTTTTPPEEERKSKSSARAASKPKHS